MESTRSKIIHTAIELIDELGLDGISMRLLACRLCIKAPSLYWHFKSKQDLLNAVTNELTQHLGRSDDLNQTWKKRVLVQACELRAALCSHRDVVRMLNECILLNENELRGADVKVGILLSANLSNKTAAWAAFATMNYVKGFVIEEQKIAHLQSLHSDCEGFPPALETTQGGLYPNLSQVSGDLFSLDMDARFEFGLTVFLDGLAAQMTPLAPSVAV